jgi:hypothetical protein
MTKDEAFSVFWSAYPRRIAKGAARKAFDKAIKKTTLETMLNAIKAYIQHKPERIDFKHPSTWLNQECWDDEWQNVPAQVQNRGVSMAGLAADLSGGRYGRNQ